MKRRRSLTFLYMSMLTLLMGSMAHADLNLETFLQQVETSNDQYRSSKGKTEAFELRENEWKLQTRPNLFATAETVKDQRLTASPVFMGVETQIKTYSLGFQQTTNFGLDAKLYYAYVDTSILGVNPTFFPVPNFILTSPVLELKQSLWRNFFGNEIAAKQEAESARLLSQRWDESFSLLNLRSEAENAYWRLVVARKLVTSTRETLERAEKIQSWSARRSQMSLSDRSDLLQAQATVATRKIELQAAIDEERAAALDFNKMRGTEETTVAEKLQLIDPKQVAGLELPQRKGTRFDVRAAQERARADRADARKAAEGSKPDVNVYATLSLNGRDARSQTAVDQAWSNDYPYTKIGVNLNVPLSVGLAANVREGYSVQAKSAELAAQRKTFETEKTWQNLVQQFEDSKRRLILATEQEEAQKKKMEYEKMRHSRGRTTTYQVILFEQDFAGAQVSRIRLESDILKLYSSLKTFGGAQ